MKSYSYRQLKVYKDKEELLGKEVVLKLLCDGVKTREIKSGILVEINESTESQYFLLKFLNANGTTSYAQFFWTPDSYPLRVLEIL